FSSGYRYHYDYHGRLLAGLPTVHGQYSGLEIWADLKLHSVASQSNYALKTFILKLDNVRVAKLHRRISDPYHTEVHKEYTGSSVYQQKLSKPVTVYMEENMVNHIEAEQTDPTWSVNVKKSILSIIQTKLVPKNPDVSPFEKDVPLTDNDATIYKVYENGIGGNCETWYQIQSIQSPDFPSYGPVLNITKTRDYKHCIHRPAYVHHNHDIRGCAWVCSHSPNMIPLHTHSNYLHHPFSECIGCPKGYETDSILAKSYSHTKYNVSGTLNNMTIEQIYSYGKTVYPAYGDELEVISHQNLTFRSVTPSQYGESEYRSSQPIRHSNLTFQLPQPIVSDPTDSVEPSMWTDRVSRYTKSDLFVTKENEIRTNSSLDISFMSIFNPIYPSEVKNTIIQILESLADDISQEDLYNSESISYKIIGLINALSVMSSHYMKALVKEVISATADRRQYEKHQIMRKLLLDALPQSGCNPAVHIIVYLIEHKLVSVNEARELVEGIPHNLVDPSEYTINEMFELIQNPEVQAHRTLFSSASIAFGKMVHRACLTPKIRSPSSPYSKRHGYSVPVTSSFFGFDQEQGHIRTPFHPAVCGPEHAKHYIEKVADLLESAGEFYKKIAYIELLSHIGHPNVLSYLKPYVIYKSPSCQSLHIDESAPENSCTFLRQVAIYALHHIVYTHPQE
ncbi:vitellogenin-2-like, partial [Limulus polyphemus]|uniref:Vitellogenin-2-like n=1 Tax=Limulus polyphemus TaxID=6850 RepID=A0ABM1RVU3_LIMPO